MLVQPIFTKVRPAWVTQCNHLGHCVFLHAAGHVSSKLTFDENSFLAAVNLDDPVNVLGNVLSLSVGVSMSCLILFKFFSVSHFLKSVSAIFIYIVKRKHFKSY